MEEMQRTGKMTKECEIKGACLQEWAKSEQEPVITVSGRRLCIPVQLQCIAVENDQNSQTVQIYCPRWQNGRDLSQDHFFLRTVNSRGGYDAVALFPEIEESRLHMRWILQPPQTSCSGRLQLQLWITGKDFDWQTAQASLYIIRQISGEPVIPAEPPVMDAFLARLSEIAAAAGRSGEQANAAALSAARFSAQAAEAQRRTEQMLSRLYLNAWNGKTMALQEMLDFIFALILRYHAEGICWADWDALCMKWEESEALNMTWDQFEIWRGGRRCM